MLEEYTGPHLDDDLADACRHAVVDIQAAIDRLTRGRLPASEGFSRIAQIASEVQRVLHNTELTSPAEREAMMERVLDDLLNGILPPAVPTGISLLDHYLSGGYAKGVHIVAGRPGSGKSVYMLQVAEHAARAGLKILYVSIEMDVRQLSLRSLARITGIPMDEIGRGDIATGDRVERLRAACRELGRWPIMFKDRGQMTSAGIYSAALRAQEQMAGLDMLVVDYLHIIRDRDRSGNQEQRLADISLALTGMAVDLGCPILVGSQLNRSSARDNREPTLHDLRGSGAIEQDALSVLALHRLVEDDDGGPRPLQVPTNLILLKQRQGIQDVRIPCLFDAPVQRFKLFENREVLNERGVPYSRADDESLLENWGIDEL